MMIRRFLRFPLFALVVSLVSRHVAGADCAISIPIQLTHAQNFDPSPSPDGKKFVFISVISGKEQLFTMDADGKNIVQLTRDDADHEDPAWSPDGTKIAFVLITKERTSIAVMNADGTNVDPLTPKEHNTIHPNWSADSKQVMYCTNDDLAPPKKNEAQINVVAVPASGGQPLHNSSHALKGSTPAEEAGQPSQFSELAAPQGASR